MPLDLKCFRQWADSIASAAELWLRAGRSVRAASPTCGW